MSSILVTGGAGYIGSITVDALINNNHKVIVVDNLSEGHEEAISAEAIFYKGDFGSIKLLAEIFTSYDIDIVIHFAADASVPLSMVKPAKFYNNNVVSSINLLDTMLKFKCKRIIFSSSAAIFGEPQFLPITEDHPKIPINPYGETKLVFENILQWYHKAYGLKFNAFRYFNAAGATDKLGEDHKNEAHIIPLIIKSIINQDNLRVFNLFGNDYPTIDGTCVRDYVHVSDIADAHILGLRNLEKNPSGKYNLGNGNGFSNLEVLKIIEKVSGKKVNYKIVERRIGDPDTLIASSNLAEKELGWKPKYRNLHDIIHTAWDWHNKYSKGYK